MFLQSLQFPCPEIQMMWKCSELWTPYICGDLSHSSLSDASSCFFESERQSRIPNLTMSRWERWSGDHYFVNAAVSPSPSTLMPVCSPWAVSLGGRAWVSCLMPEAHQAWSKQADTSSHTYQTGTQCPNLPIALTQCHFMYMCWISF